MKRDLTPEDLEKITQAILAGDRIEATNIYISITERGLTEAQAFIKALTFEVRNRRIRKCIHPRCKRGAIFGSALFLL